MSAPPSSTEELLRRIESGERVKYLHFWGHRARPDGSIGPSCLSQWWPAPFEADGVGFASAEHYMMWSKARLFGDEPTAARILNVSHPNEAKTLGRTIAGFDEPTWERERFAIVVAGSIAKFAAHAGLREFLLGTGKRVLVEASPLDRVWGIGLAADDRAANDPARWRGLNLLGFALMRARHELAGRGEGRS
ncbi:NADAR family protein [Dactylosporangium sp. CA-233914]|uniref:NADAR family protein n=1 Tax=Dactylosporangium sp. CA-233914 TaxID=3239934 RepID=UPI003D92B671